MRTTLTLEEDVAKRLKHCAKSTGQSFKSVVNEILRLGLLSKENSKRSGGNNFKVTSFDMGTDGDMDFDNVHELLASMED